MTTAPVRRDGRERGYVVFSLTLKILPSQELGMPVCWQLWFCQLGIPTAPLLLWSGHLWIRRQASQTPWGRGPSSWDAGHSEILQPRPLDGASWLLADQLFLQFGDWPQLPSPPGLPLASDHHSPRGHGSWASGATPCLGRLSAWPVADPFSFDQHIFRNGV